VPALIALGVAACGAGDAAVETAPRYETTFTGSESPLSENGAWRHTGRHWTQVAKHDGVVHGTQTGRGGYDDSYAYLSGFPPDQSASAVIHLDPNTNDATKEVELLLRWSDTPDGATGYECNLHHRGGWAQIMRWNGKFGDFTELGHARRPPKPKTGDVMRATIVGNVIRVYLNDKLIVEATDSTHRSGNPGIGFFIRGDTSNAAFGFTRFVATGLDAGQRAK
jgi:hypothetical protein